MWRVTSPRPNLGVQCKFILDSSKKASNCGAAWIMAAIAGFMCRLDKENKSDDRDQNAYGYQ
jgi:hypothetical protein